MKVLLATQLAAVLLGVQCFGSTKNPSTCHALMKIANGLDGDDPGEGIEPDELKHGADVLRAIGCSEFMATDAELDERFNKYESDDLDESLDADEMKALIASVPAEHQEKLMACVKEKAASCGSKRRLDPSGIPQGCRLYNDEGIMYCFDPEGQLPSLGKGEVYPEKGTWADPRNAYDYWCERCTSGVLGCTEGTPATFAYYYCESLTSEEDKHSDLNDKDKCCVSGCASDCVKCEKKGCAEKE